MQVVGVVQVIMTQEGWVALEAAVQVQVMVLWQLLQHLIQEEEAEVQVSVLANAKVVMVARVS
jgi:hypothetical protein